MTDLDYAPDIYISAFELELGELYECVNLLWSMNNHYVTLILVSNH